ncbi:hypothetical protein HDV63DRAFT_232506 [Trichoderma sp. SZMC 28014]
MEFFFPSFLPLLPFFRLSCWIWGLWDSLHIQSWSSTPLRDLDLPRHIRGRDTRMFRSLESTCPGSVAVPSSPFGAVTCDVSYRQLSLSFPLV